MTWELTPELSDKICDELIEGRSLRSICKDEGMPSVGTVMRWLAKNDDFCKQYAYARDAQADTIFDETLEIADNSTDDIEIIQSSENGSRPAIKHSAIARARLQIDTRKWYAGKLKPKKYGDSQTIKGDKENPLTFVPIQIIDNVPDME